MNETGWRLTMGAEVRPAGVYFRVWAPAARVVEVEIHGSAGPNYHRLDAETGEVLAGLVPDVGAGTLYKYRLDEGQAYPDPYSRSQPEGVHAPSAVVDPTAYEWHDASWQGLSLQGLVLYQCHVGTYTPEGTFAALADQLPEIKKLGVNALQILPIAAFPGSRNWGYDGVDLYAPTANYGGPLEFKRFVDTAHGEGLGVVLDVVYNHLGPDGNYLRAYSPFYFTDRYHTPWGDALNYDGEHSHWVREYVVQNACYWLNEYHVDGLRLDATHAIFDKSPRHILRELSERARASLPPGRQVVLIAEHNGNDVRFLHPPEAGGYGLDLIYADDFHHEMRVILTGEREGYYVDYEGSADNVAKIIQEGFLYQGQLSAYMGRPRGTPTTDEPARQFLYCLQNHDQVGNRAFGERLNHMLGRNLYATASALLLLVPETPLIFMGQEFAASTPFLYFTDHNPELGKLVTIGRREEFKRFSAFSDPERREQIPDPQAEATFLRSKLDL
ncbi:MAG: malto-oligosyltrehalose trehalohydrolase, partial [Dehalococcoidales bacterium]|nr:malto-oligosyltrehalose trehalohydrolase [Dehalococcoidales bacterium]